MLSSLRSQQVLAEVIDAFGDLRVPERPVDCECDECQDIHADFVGRTWQDVDARTVEKHYDALPLFSDEAFVYYLPAYMRRDLLAGPRFSERVLYALAPGDRARETFFSPQQS